MDIDIAAELLADAFKKAIDAGLYEFYIPVKLMIDNDNEEIRGEIADPVPMIETQCGIECPNLKPAVITINGMPIKPDDLALRLQG